MQHEPVLRSSVLQILQPVSGEIVLDVTTGLGGHAKAFLEKIGPSGRYIGLDADKANLSEAARRLQDDRERVRLIHVNFRELPALQLDPVDIIFADLGLSSPHLDDPARGFSFRAEGPLDMRFDQSSGPSAQELIRNTDEAGVYEILSNYGELPRSGLLAKVLKKARPETTQDVTRCAEEVYGHESRKFLPQVFQALRIAVNNELHAVSMLLSAGPGLLKSGGRMGIISFHSLEDRMVKQTFRALTTGVKDDLTGQISVPASFELITRRAIRPDEEEVAANPRSRSAVFRAIRRL